MIEIVKDVVAWIIAVAFLVSMILLVVILTLQYIA